MGDPTWFHAFLLLGAVTLGGVGLGWLLSRKKR
ncbi:MAG: LPXTG cell wall anchor domain-containing protein [Kofleriaceae bacterium]